MDGMYPPFADKWLEQALPAVAPAARLWSRQARTLASVTSAAVTTREAQPLKRRKQHIIFTCLSSDTVELLSKQSVLCALGLMN